MEIVKRGNTANKPDNRYDMRQDADGTWCVYDIFTGQPAEVNSIPQMGSTWKSQTIWLIC